MTIYSGLHQRRHLLVVVFINCESTLIINLANGLIFVKRAFLLLFFLLIHSVPSPVQKYHVNNVRVAGMRCYMQCVASFAISVANIDAISQ